MQTPNVSIQVSLTEGPIETEVLFNDRHFGAEVRFLGVVRGREAGEKISGIRYTAYAEMAERMLHEIVGAFQQSAGAHPVLVQHRLGFVAAGEASIVIALAQAHSAEAFDLLGAYLRRIKAEVPIWKHPVFIQSATP